jgi:type III pantothenate kinase
LVWGQKVTGAVLCSVVPKRDQIWRRTLRALYGVKPLEVSHKIKLGVKIAYPRPATIGADRLANASAAVAAFGCPVIVIDFGTALTFDVVSAAGAYIGGVIAPGPALMTDYLAERTALLPRINLVGRYGRIGKSTVEAMRIGARVGYRGMVREILNHLCSRTRPQPKLVATGGYAALVLRGFDCAIPVAPNLTLEGLIRIHKLNR